MMQPFWKKAKPDYATRQELSSLISTFHKVSNGVRADLAIEAEGLRREIAELKSLKLKVDPDGSAPSLAYMQGQIAEQSAEIARLAGRYENVSDRVDGLSARVECCESELLLDIDPPDDDDEDDLEEEDDVFLDDEDDDLEEFDDDEEEEEYELPPGVIARIREEERRRFEEALAEAKADEPDTKDHPPVIEVTGEVIVNGMRDMGWDATGKDGE
jgi:hypothetical protein